MNRCSLFDFNRSTTVPNVISSPFPTSFFAKYIRRHKEIPRPANELINAIEDYPSIAKDLQAHLDKVMRTTHLTEGQLGQISETDTPAAVPGVKW